MTLNVQDLVDIAAICDEGSFRKAAAKIGISQPTLSDRVTQMERRLGAVLFERSQGRSRPTQLAETIAAQSSDLLRQLGGFVNQVGALSTGHGGVVRMGFGPVTEFLMLEDLVHRISEALPEIVLDVRTHSAGAVMGLLAAGEIDLAYCDGDPGLMRPEFQREFVLRDRQTVLVRADHPLAKQAIIPFEDLFAYPVALPNLDPRYREIVSRAAGRDPFTLAGAVFCSNLRLLLSLVESGRYSTVLPPFGFDHAYANGSLVEIELLKLIEHEICLYSNHWALPLPAIGKVVELVRQQGAEIEQRLQARAG